MTKIYLMYSIMYQSAYACIIHSQQHVVAVSDSLGMVSIVNCEGAEFRVQQSWRAHEFEAWIVCLGQQPHRVFSGGDDCRLCVWDTRTRLERPAMTSRE